MRAAAGAALLSHAATTIHGSAPIGQTVHALGAGVVGALLLAGLWTPVAALLAALEAAWNAISSPADVALWSLLMIIAVALALLGPGAWSIDARLFGWRRVDLRDRDQ